MTVTSTRRTTATRRTGSTTTRGELPYKAMVRLARKHGLQVTSTTGGKHNKGSLHARGRAIDVRTRGVSSRKLNAFMRDARKAGYQVMDERVRRKELELSVLQGRCDDLSARHSALLATPRNRPPDCVCEALLQLCNCVKASGFKPA